MHFWRIDRPKCCLVYIHCAKFQACTIMMKTILCHIFMHARCCMHVYVKEWRCKNKLNMFQAWLLRHLSHMDYIWIGKHMHQSCLFTSWVWSIIFIWFVPILKYVCALDPYFFNHINWFHAGKRNFMENHLQGFPQTWLACTFNKS